MAPPSRTVQILTGLLSVASCAWMSALLVRTWVDPMAVEGGRWVSLAVGIMAMEFILVHSGAMIAGAGMTERAPWVMVAILVLLYLPFGLTFAFAFKSQLLLFSFIAIMVPRVVNALGGTPESRTLTFARSGFSAGLYLAVVFLSVLAPFPAGGIDTAVLDAVYPDRGTGEWEREPQRALGAGAIYFGVLALVELGVMLRQSKRTAAGATATLRSPG